MNPYHRMSIGEKQTLAVERQREPPVPCPAGCGTQLLAEDVIAHVRERCTGQREPGPAARWIPFARVLAMGVPRNTLSYWARSGKVRFRGGRGDRQYLLGDVAQKVAQRLGFRRR